MVLIAAFPVRDSLSVLIQVIDLAAFCAPPAVIIQRADGEQDMYMGVAGPFVVDGKIGAHTC